MTTITDDERKAREWLQWWVDGGYGKPSQMARTILARLDAPRMPRPEDVPDEVVGDMLRVIYEGSEVKVFQSDLRRAIGILYDHYTPQPKKVEAWAIMGHDGTIDAVKLTEVDAQKWAAGRRIVRLVEAADE